MGGRLLSLASAWLLALLTDRVLLVNFPYGSSLFCEPFVNSPVSWMLPVEMLPQLNRFVSLETALRRRGPVRLARIKSPADDNFLSCHGNLKTLLEHVQVLLVESPGPFAELLLANPSHKNRIQELFPGQQVYTILLQQLLRPSNVLWLRIINWYSNRATAEGYSLGIYSKTLSDDQFREALMGRNPLKSKDMVYSLKKTLTNFRTESYPGWNEHPLYLKEWNRYLFDLHVLSRARSLYLEDSLDALAVHYYRGRNSSRFGHEQYNELKDQSRNCTIVRQQWRERVRLNLSN